MMKPEHMARLSLATLKRHRLFIDAPESLEKLVVKYSRILARVKDGKGQLEFLEDNYKLNQKPLAFFLMWHEQETFFCEPVTFILFQFDLDSQEARQWIKNCLSSVVYPDDTLLEVDEAYNEIFPVLLEAGLSIDAISLVGLVSDALNYLNETTTNLGAEYRFKKVTCDDVQSVLQLYRESYTEKHGWFINKPEFLKKKHEWVQQTLDDNKHYHFLVEYSGQSLGYFHGSVFDYIEEPFWGTVGGIEPVLHPVLQKQGLARHIYRFLLTEFHKRGMRVFKGHTSQAPVMHLGRLMNRERVSTSFRKKAFFKSEYFDGFKFG